APPLLWLAAGRGRPKPDNIDVVVALETGRCFEGERVHLGLQLGLPSGVELLSAQLVLPVDVQLAGGPPVAQAVGSDGLAVDWSVEPQRWGRRRIAVRVILRSSGRLAEALVERPIAELVVHPRPVDADASLVPTELLAQLGEHISRTVGEGVQ